MKTAVDSSALLAIFNGEEDGPAWLTLLVESRRQGQLVICDVVYAELAPGFASNVDLHDALDKLGIRYESITTAAAWRAGTCFRAYRRSGGPREHLIPDFLIAAHAEVQADCLAAVDRGYLRRYFSKLRVLRP